MSNLLPFALLIGSLQWCSASPVELRDAPGVEYTVVGDSWAAGSGAGGLATRWPKDAESNCDQDPGSYASLLQKDTDMNIAKLNFQACSAQTPEQVFDCQVGSDHPPSDGECKTAKPTGLGRPGLMTIQMGADALDLEKLIRTCFYEGNDAGCQQAQKTSQAAIDSLNKSHTILNTIKAAIRKTGIKPSKVLIPNYVVYFNADTPDHLCNPSSEVNPSKQLREQTNDLIRNLNGVIARDAKAAGAVLIDVDRPGGPFDTHRWCDTKPSYFTDLYTEEDIKLWNSNNSYVGRLWRPTGAGYFAYHNAIREHLKLKDLPLPGELAPKHLGPLLTDPDSPPKQPYSSPHYPDSPLNHPASPPIHPDTHSDGPADYFPRIQEDPNHDPYIPNTNGSVNKGTGPHA